MLLAPISSFTENGSEQAMFCSINYYIKENFRERYSY